MNFIEYGFTIICFEFLFWYYIFLILSLPSMPFIYLLRGATREQKTHAKKALLVPILVGLFVFGTLVPVLFYSAGIFAITNFFMHYASHPVVYAVVGGLLCFAIIAPSGERNLLGVVVSVASYILYMTILGEFGQNVSDMGFRIVNVMLAILVPVFIVGLIIRFVFWVVSKARGGRHP